MGQRQSVKRAILLVHAEALRTKEHRQAIPLGIAQTRQELSDALGALAQDASVDELLEVEQAFLATEREQLANSRSMETSLDTALTELDAAGAALSKVSQDPAAYKALDQDLSLPKNRVGDLPRDQARQFFRSHLTRLGNLDKARLDDSEKQLLAYRTGCLKAAERQYTQLQTQALNIEEPPALYAV